MGAWRLVRDITHDDGGRARFSGRAGWRADGTGAVYEESGVLDVAGQSFAAERRYHWSASMEVCFEDGRPFHRVPAMGGVVSHLCPPDLYEGRYDFSGWPAWRVSWRVTGPRKAYVMVSRYAPA